MKTQFNSRFRVSLFGARKDKAIKVSLLGTNENIRYHSTLHINKTNIYCNEEFDINKKVFNGEEDKSCELSGRSKRIKYDCVIAMNTKEMLDLINNTLLNYMMIDTYSDDKFTEQTLKLITEVMKIIREEIIKMFVENKLCEVAKRKLFYDIGL